MGQRCNNHLRLFVCRRMLGHPGKHRHVFHFLRTIMTAEWLLLADGRVEDTESWRPNPSYDPTGREEAYKEHTGYFA